MSSSFEGGLTIAMVAGEASGDNLGAALIKEITKSSPDVSFFGVGGPAMIREGFSSTVDIELLSVNGFIDPVFRLPSLIRLLFHLRDLILKSNVDCFVGIDSNFFNLLLEGMLRKRGVKTVHYVSPTVWAWRKRRIKKIARSVDLMMTLYPFETEIYEKNNVPVVFVGHPKAEEILPDDGKLNQAPSRDVLGISQDEIVVAIIPGSRAREVDLSGRDFLRTAVLLEDSVTHFVIPAANKNRYEQLASMLMEFPMLEGKVTLLLGQSREAITASNVVIVNSGTATLEAMLLRKPMVVSYRVGKITYAIVSRLVTTQRFALPNILAGKRLVPEFIQDAAIPSEMAMATKLLLLEKETDDLIAKFDDIHSILRKNANPGAEAAKAVLNLCGV